jgi:hypothetical protein
MYKILRFLPAVLFCIICTFLFYSVGIVRANDHCTIIGTPLGCSMDCPITDPYCNECTGQEEFCDAVPGTQPLVSCTATCPHLDGCSCPESCNFTGEIDQGQTCGGYKNGGGGSSPSPSPSPSWVPRCGDGACNGTETQASCPGDCGSPETCGNGVCSAVAGENCSNCPGDCTVGCNSCGDGICGNSPGEACDACIPDCGECADPEYCGDNICNNGEDCSWCPGDCGACSNPFCGDGTCSGTEQCDQCVSDCGVCPQGNAWFQIAGGSIFAALSSGTAVQVDIPTSTCTEPTCKPYLITRDSNNTVGSAGSVVTGGGIVDDGGYTTQGTSNLVVTGSPITRVTENYAYFYRRYSIGLNPVSDFTVGGNEPSNAQKPTYDENKKYYYSSSSMTINDLWDVAAGESYVIFVNGNLRFTDPSTLRQLTNVANGGMLAFIVSGDIIVDDSVGNLANSSTSNLEGIFIADGEIIIESVSSGADRRFNGEGTFIGWSGIDLQRSLSDTNNQTIPAERFTYRPDMVENTPQEMKRSQIIWQETN